MRAAVLAAAALGLGAAGANAGTFTVTSTASGTTTDGVSLRWAIAEANANPGSTINFSVTGTIRLASSLPTISESMTINGPGSALLTVSGNNAYQVVDVDTTPSVSISGLTLANGKASNGGAIALDHGVLTVADCAFTSNTASSEGGAITTGINTTLTVSGSTFYGNSGAVGGAIQTSSTLTVTDSTFYGNSGSFAGGAIDVADGTTTVTNDTFYDNSTSSGNGGAIYDGDAVNAFNNIFSGNTAGYIGGGIDNNGTANGSNNVYYNNLAGGSEDDCNGCNSGGPGSGGSFDATSNPLTLPLGYWGGTTETMLPQPGSQAICKGSSTATDLPANDQRGFSLTTSTCTSGYVDAGADQTNYIEVQASGDSGAGASDCPGASCTLRDAIAAITGSGDIDFASTVTSVQLGTSGLTLRGSPGVTIVGNGANQTTVSGSNGAGSHYYSVFTVNSGSTATLYGLTITGGNAGDGGYGGGVYSYGTLAIVDSAVSSAVSANHAGYGGGVYNDLGGWLTMSGSTVSGNTAAVEGGGMYNNGMLTMTESTVYGNSDSSLGGGGIDENYGVVTITNSTIADNTDNSASSGGGGGILVEPSSLMVLANSIVAGNTSASTGANIEGPYVDGGGNAIGGSDNANSSDLGGNTNYPITLSGLQLNGLNATVPTAIPLPGSSGICAAETANVPSGVTTDERGYPLQPSGGYCTSTAVDSGAVQTNYTSVAFVTQPSNVAVSTAMLRAPTVQVIETDTLLSSSNTDAVNGVPVSVTAASGTVSGGSATTTGGLATFGSLEIGTPEMDDTLSTVAIPLVGSTTLASVTSSSFNVTGPATQLVVSGPGSANAGTPFSVTVTAEDSAGNVVPGYSGTASFSTSDPNAAVSLPVNYTFQPATDSGTHNFSVTLVTAGSQTVIATDVAAHTITGYTSISVSADLTVTQVAVSGIPTSVYAGVPYTGTVTVEDQYGNAETGYPSSSATMTTADSSATVTSPVTITNGAGRFTVTFATLGPQSVTAAISGLTPVPETGITVNAIPSYVVTTLADQTDASPDCTSGTGSTCSLRDAITAANSAGTVNISFAAGLTSVASPGTITLGTGSAGDIGLPGISGYVNITGPGANQLTVSGNNDANVGSVITVNSGATVMIYGLTIADGNMPTGDGSGGGIGNNGGTLTVANSTFSGNSATTYGGGIYSAGATAVLMVSDSTFSRNTAGDGGGIHSGNRGTATVTNSTFSDNSVNDTGGAITNDRATLTVTGSTFSANQVTHYNGGAIINDDGGAMTANNNIFVGNTAAGGGAGIYDTADKVHASDNVYYQNLDGGTTEDDCNGCATNTNPVSGDPNLAPLGNYGGPTQTMIPLPGSAAICAGSSTLVPSGVTTDQRGEPNENASYTGYSAGSPCVDAGAVQTHYSLSFSTEPQPISPAATIYQSANFEAGVTLNESGNPFTPAVSIPLTLTGSGALANNTATTASGVASYSTLQVSASGTNDKLTATLELNPAISSTSPAVSVASSSFDVIASTAPTITSADKAVFFYGENSSFTVTATGTPTPALSYSGSYTFSQLGLTFHDNGNGTATISGIMTGTPGQSYPFTIEAANGVSPDASQSFTLASDNPITFNPPATLSATAGNKASAQLSASGGTGSFTYSISPAPPAWVTLGASTGQLTAFPPTVTAPVNYTLTATDSLGGSASGPIQVIVNAAPTITTTSLPAATVNVAYSTTIAESGGSGPPTTWGLSPSVSGFSIDSTTGVLSGTATASGPIQFNVTFTDEWGATTSKQLTLTVDQAPAFTSANSSTFAVGALGSFTVVASGYPTPTFSKSGALPSGVTLTSGGVLSGTPAAGTGGSYPITITASNGVGTNATQGFTLTVDQAPAITTANSVTFTTGTPGTFTVATTAYPIAALSEGGALPSGVTFTDNGNGTATLAGTAAAGTANTYPLTVMAVNGISPSASQSFTLTVVPPPSFIVTTTSDSGTGSLRQALADAATVGGNITFSPAVFGSGATITLTSGTLNIPSNTTITGLTTGSGATLTNLVTVSGSNSFRVFTAASGVTEAAIIDLTIANGQSSSVGGGLDNSGTLSIANTTFTGNASGGSYFGGGIYNLGTLTVTGSTFSHNTAGQDGGGIYNDGTLTVTNSTFAHNTGNSGNQGGGIANAATLTVADSTFSGNTAGNGGAILNNGGTLKVTNSIFADNSAPAGGGAIYNNNSSDTANAQNNVYWHDLGSGVEDDCNGCTSNSSAISASSDPVAALGNFGGPTQTMIPLPGSVAICAGLSTLVPAGVTTDQRGAATGEGGYCPAGSVDAGAVQTDYSIAWTVPPSTVVQNTTMPTAPEVTLSESGTPFFDGTDTIAIPLTLTTGSGTLTGGSGSTSATTGIATYSSLAISLPGTSDQLTATLSLDPALTPPLSIAKTSATFDVNSAVTQLAFSTAPPLTVTAGGNAGSSIVVQEEDVSGTLVTTASDTITLTVTGPNSYTKTYTQVASSGVASFNLSAAQFSTGGAYSYVASISASSVTEATANETVDAAPAASVSVVSGSVQSAVIGQAFATSLKVQVEDQYSNPVSGATVVFTGPGTGAGATFSAPAATATDGTTSVTATANGTAGTTAYMATASVSGATTTASFTLTNTQHATTLTVTPTATALVYGKPVTVSASISPASVLTSAPMGSITFYEGLTALSPASTVSSAAASYTVSVPTVGSHPYAAQYGGDSNFQQSTLTSAPAALVVSKASSTLTGPTSPVSLTYGTGSAVSINVAGQYSGTGIATPSGSVTYTIGSGAAQTAAIASGVASLAIPATQGQGSYTVAVSYTGDGNYNAAAPIHVTLNINQATLTLTAYNATKVYGTANPAFAGMVTGQQNGDTLIEHFSTSATISSPVNTYAIVPSVTGTNLADYTQVANNGTLTVTKAGTTTTLGVSSASITPGQNETLTAQVVSSTTGTPAGTVSFYDGTTLLSTATMSSGVASFSTATLAPGVTHTLTAAYSGDTNFIASSTASSTTVTVAPLNFTMTLSGPSNLTVVPGQSIIYKVTVTPDYGSYAGTVNFAISGLPPGATVSFSPSSIATNGGPQTITVTIQTAPATAMLHREPTPSGRRKLAPFALALLFLFGAGSLRKRGRVLRRMLCVIALLTGGAAATLSLSGCGSTNGFFGQTPQNYTITITATAGTLVHTTTVTLNVQ